MNDGLMRACLSKFILACTDAGDDSTIDEQIGTCYILLSIRSSLSNTSQTVGRRNFWFLHRAGS